MHGIASHFPTLVNLCAAPFILLLGVGYGVSLIGCNGGRRLPLPEL